MGKGLVLGSTEISIRGNAISSAHVCAICIYARHLYSGLVPSRPTHLRGKERLVYIEALQLLAISWSCKGNYAIGVVGKITTCKP